MRKKALISEVNALRRNLEHAQAIIGAKMVEIDTLHRRIKRLESDIKILEADVTNAASDVERWRGIAHRCDDERKKLWEELKVAKNETV